MELNSKKEKVDAGIALTGILLFILGLVALTNGIVTFNDWLFWVPLTIGIAEVVWFVSSLKPRVSSNVNGLKCSRCGRRFADKKHFDWRMRFDWCNIKKGKEIYCTPVKDKKPFLVKGENVFWFTAKWKFALLITSAFVSAGVLHGKKIVEEHYAMLGLLLIVVAVIFVFVWLNTLKFKKNEVKGDL